MRTMIPRTAITLFVTAGIFAVPAKRSTAQETKPALKRIALPQPNFVEKATADRTGRMRKYVVYVPPDYNADKRWPAILYLHGIGERGRDGRKQCTIGIGPAILEYGGPFPFIVMFPQAVDFDRTDDDLAMTILDITRREYNVDPDRVYLSGLSMGGIGTWRIGTRHPDRFAAIAPVCGRTDPMLAVNLTYLPTWCFHGDADPVVPVEDSRRMIAAMRTAGLKPRYTEYPGVTHNSWDNAYATRELYTWLLKHKRVRKPKSITYRFGAWEFETPHTVWWLRLEKVTSEHVYGQVDAAITAAGALRVDTRGVERCTLLLDRAPGPKARAWTVTVNGTQRKLTAEDNELAIPIAVGGRKK
jgi:poly(3-hydroxybutyrate) depolymerase